MDMAINLKKELWSNGVKEYWPEKSIPSAPILRYTRTQGSSNIVLYPVESHPGYSCFTLINNN
jgi:hypothetical protein